MTSGGTRTPPTWKSIPSGCTPGHSALKTIRSKSPLELHRAGDVREAPLNRALRHREPGLTAALGGSVSRAGRSAPTRACPRCRIGSRTVVPNAIVYVVGGLVPNSSGASLRVSGGEKSAPEKSVELPSSGLLGWIAPPVTVTGAPSKVPDRTVFPVRQGRPVGELLRLRGRE